MSRQLAFRQCILVGMEGLEMCQLRESDIHVVVTGFPSGVRDFCLLCQAEDETLVPVQPLSLLGLERSAVAIQQLAERGRADLAMNLALCRLLVPQLRYRGSGRHLVVENWQDDDLRGASLQQRPGNLFARDLSSEQAADWRLVSGEEQPVEDSLAELAWRSFTALPELEERFEDPDLGEFSRALHQKLVAPGRGSQQVQFAQITSQVAELRRSDFKGLGLKFQPRKLHQLFRRFLAVTLRWSGQLTGVVAEQLIRERCLAAGDQELVRPLSENEKQLLDLRYGAPRILSDINIGYLFGCGDIFADLINDYATALIQPDSPEHLEEAGDNLRDFFFLLAQFLERRRALRAEQRRELRERRSRRLPGGAERRQAQNERDDSSKAPSRNAIVGEALEMFRALLPKLKDRDQRRLQAFIDAGGNRRDAAESLGITLTAYSRQLRQTVFPNIRRLAAEEPELLEHFENIED